MVGRSAHEWPAGTFDHLDAFARFGQCDRAGMRGPRAVVLEELMQLRRASQSKRTDADNNRHRYARATQQ